MSQEQQFDKRESYDQAALDEASRELHMFFLREGSRYGTKACEEIGRVFMTAYLKATPTNQWAGTEIIFDTAPSHALPKVLVVDDGHVGMEAVRKLLESDTHEQAINLEGVTGDEMDKSAERAALLTRLMAAGEPRETTPSTIARSENVEAMKLRIKVIDADRMAAIVDEMVRSRHLDARSKLADARLDYGHPWNPEGMRQGAEMLASTRENADYWQEGARHEPNREAALQNLHQAVNAWKNAAYHLADKLASAASAIAWKPWTENPPMVEEPAVYAVLVDCGDGSLEAMNNLTMDLAEWGPELQHGGSNWPDTWGCAWNKSHINYWFPVELGEPCKRLRAADGGKQTP